MLILYTLSPPQALAMVSFNEDGIVNCSATFPSFTGDSVRNLTNDSLSCDLVLVGNTTFENVLQECINTQANCLDNDAFFDEINRQVSCSAGIRIASAHNIYWVASFLGPCLIQLHKGEAEG